MSDTAVVVITTVFVGESLLDCSDEALCEPITMAVEIALEPWNPEVENKDVSVEDEEPAPLASVLVAEKLDSTAVS